MTPNATPEPLRDYFRYLDRKVSFLGDLYEDGRKEEALALCCTYIEGLGQRIRGSDSRGSKQRFVETVIDYGNLPYLTLVHPPTLTESLRGCGKEFAAVATILDPHFCGLPIEVRPIEEFVHASSAVLCDDQLGYLRKKIYLGTLAALAYNHFRNPLAHSLHSDNGVVFTETYYRGEPVGRLSFEPLYAALRNILNRAKKALEQAARRCLQEEA